jgi:hypothetical protein
MKIHLGTPIILTLGRLRQGLLLFKIFYVLTNYVSTKLKAKCGGGHLYPSTIQDANAGGSLEPRSLRSSWVTAKGKTSKQTNWEKGERGSSLKTRKLLVQTV